MKYLVLLLLCSIAFSDNIYDYQINDIDGNTLNLSDYHGKKILFVNTATNSQYVNQYADLETLYQKFKDSLVIIATPSDAYGNESLENDSIKSFVLNNYSVHYILAAKATVTGDSIEPVYKWLTDSSLNHVFENPVNGDFFKYLVDQDGNMVGVFDGSINPMDSTIQKLITNQ